MIKIVKRTADVKGYGNICKSCLSNEAAYILTFGCENATSTILLCRDCSKYLVEHFGNLIREDEEE